MWQSYCLFFVSWKLIFKSCPYAFLLSSSTEYPKVAIITKYLHLSDENDCILSNTTDHLRDLSIFTGKRKFICTGRVIFRSSLFASIDNGFCSTLRISYISKLGWFNISEEFIDWCSSLRHSPAYSPHKYTCTYSSLHLPVSKMCFLNPMLVRYSVNNGFGGQTELGNGTSQTGFSRIQTLRCSLTC